MELYLIRLFESANVMVGVLVQVALRRKFHCGFLGQETVHVQYHCND